MEIVNKLPEELVWNVIKYLKHPCADMIDDTFNKWDYDICCCCEKIIFMRKNESAFLYYTVKTVCGNCYRTNAKDIISNYKDEWRFYPKICFNLKWEGEKNNDSDAESDIY
jgi:hypothetical protein